MAGEYLDKTTGMVQVERLTISTAQLKALRPLHLPPINPVVYRGSSSDVTRNGDLILGWVSHLDAFSAYPDQT